MEIAVASEPINPEPVNHGFLEAVSPSMRAVEAMIVELAQSELPVLLLAEAGAGKRATAERIHLMSGRRNQSLALRVVRCAELTPEQFEASAEGVFGDGTVFMKEVADLSPACQGRLFEALSQARQNGRETRMGARFIFASARDLEDDMKAGRFREDLYYRISGVCLRLPPLRQRKEDIPYLMSFFLSKYAKEFQRPVPGLSAQTQVLFQEYAWPGNVRELEGAAKAIVALGDESLAMSGLRSLLQRAGGNGERVSLKQAARAASREAERELILKALARTRWNRRRAAQELQISYKALLYKLKQIGCGQYEVS
jgi:two-component system response regulator AtoC